MYPILQVFESQMALNIFKMFEFENLSGNLSQFSETWFLKMEMQST